MAQVQPCTLREGKGWTGMATGCIENLMRLFSCSWKEVGAGAKPRSITEPVCLETLVNCLLCLCLVAIL